MPGNVTGNLTDVGIKPLSGRFPRLSLRLDEPTTFGANLIVTDRYNATINDATGAFVFAGVVGSDEMLPPRTYTLTADWDANTYLDVLSGLRVPAGGGTISDIIAASTVTWFGSDYVYVGPTAPTGPQQWMFWIDTSVTPPLLKEWSNP